MFSVYGLAGREFIGTLEQLRSDGLDRIARVSRAQALPAHPGPALDSDARAVAPGLSTDSAFASLADEANRIYTRTQLGDLPQRHPLTRVDEVMHRDAVTVPHTATVMQGWQVLSRHGVGQAPVVDDATGTLVGMLLRADLLPAPDGDAHAWGALLHQPVTALMVTPVPGAARDTDLRRVAQLLLDTGLPGLPVTDSDGGVVGFVSRSDILRAVVNDPPLDLWS